MLAVLFHSHSPAGQPEGLDHAATADSASAGSSRHAAAFVASAAPDSLNIVGWIF